MTAARERDLECGFGNQLFVQLSAALRSYVEPQKVRVGVTEAPAQVDTGLVLEAQLGIENDQEGQEEKENQEY